MRLLVTSGGCLTRSVRCPRHPAQPQSQSCPREGDEELGLGSPSGGRWPPARVASLVPKVLTGPGGRLSTWFTHLESKTVKPVTQEQWPPRGTLATSGDVRAGCCRRLEGGGRRCCSRSRGAQDGPPCWWCPWEAPPSERPGLCERSRHLSLLKSLFLLFRGVLFIRLIGFTVSPPFAPSGGKDAQEDRAQTHTGGQEWQRRRSRLGPPHLRGRPQGPPHLTLFPTCLFLKNLEVPPAPQPL